MNGSMKRAVGLSAMIIVMAGLVQGCQTFPYTWQGSAAKTVDRNLAEASRDTKSAAEVPPDVAEALLPPMEVGGQGGGAVPLEPRFDIAVSRAPARQVYMSLVEGTKYSIVVHPDVNGLVSLNLKDVTVPEAIDALRDVYAFHYRRDGDRFYILSRGMQTRIFPVNYLNLERKGKSRTRVVSGELTQGTQGSTSTGQASGSGSSGRSGAQVDAGMQVETRSDSDFWKELADTLKAIIGDKQGRSVVVNPQAGVVVVRAMPEELVVVEQFLGITHDTVNRQVVLEAKIIEVELSEQFQAGINWSQIGNARDVNFTGSQVGGGTIFSGNNTSSIASSPFTLDPTSGLFNPVGGTGTTAFGGVFTLAVQSANFTAFIEALKAQGNVHVLSSPRVSTVNNQKAVIKVGGDEFFVTGVSQTAVTTGVATALVPTVELTPFFSGIALDVTPQIDPDKNVILHIHPSVSDVVQQNKVFVINGDDFDLPLAASNIRESDNVVRSHSGQVVVIGGLMKEGSTDDNASIPFLGDIPIIGNLFKHKKVVRIKKELVILLKPTVVDVAQQWDDMIRSSRERTEGMKRRSW